MNKKHLFKIILTITIISGLAIAIYVGMGKSRISKERYVRHEIFLGKWGTGNGQIGFKEETFVSSYGDVAGKVVLPDTIAVDKEGNIYLADILNHRIQKFSPEGKFLMKIGGKEDPNRYFENIRDIEVDLEGNIYISNNDQKRVIQFGPDGQFKREFLFAEEFPSWAEGPLLAMDAQRNNLYMWFGGPQWIYKYDDQGNFRGKGKPEFNTDLEGNYYDMDYDTQEIRKFDPQGKLVDQIKWDPKEKEVDPKLTVGYEGDIYLTLPEVEGFVSSIIREAGGLVIIKYELVK